MSERAHPLLPKIDRVFRFDIGVEDPMTMLTLSHAIGKLLDLLGVEGAVMKWEDITGTIPDYDEYMAR